MLARVVRIRLAIKVRPIVTAGRTIYLGPYQPETGNQCRCTANQRIIRRPSQKIGMDTPSIPNTRRILSIHVFCRFAAIIPNRMPSTMAITQVTTARINVVGKR